jgi:mediator of RNA polymerase II transcription subunit 7
VQVDNWIKTRDENTEEEPVDQEALLPDEALLPSFPLLELEPPRLDWILEEEAYESFGVIHQARENFASLSIP